ncbi:site-2 protease family protein [Aquisphaera insulae]|uniref:site-2 protease family protein n=1 Tax=Aquisphaera insulae TaxID=2712864 RepID=UPI0013E9CA05|nr:site-2 protease family protein [Aquisphaera insulae]
MLLCSLTTGDFGPYHLLFLLPAAFLTIHVHELGHAVVGRLCGFVVTSFGSGLFRPLLVLNLRGTRLYACRSHSFMGLTHVWYPQLLPSRLRSISFYGGGILANGLLAVVAGMLLARATGPRGLWMALFLMNAFTAIGSLIPHQFRAGKVPLRSDGMLMLQTLRFGTIPTPLPVSIETSLGLRPHLEAIGDIRGLRIRLLGIVVEALELGDLSRAEELYHEAESLAPDEVPSIRACQALVTASLAASTGDRARAADLIDSAASAYDALGHPVGRLMTAWVRADLRALDGDVPGQVTDLRALAADETAARHPWLRTRLQAARMTAEAGLAVAGPGSMGAASLVAAYERMRNVHLTPALDLRFYRAIARACLEKGDQAGAELALPRLIAAIRSLADSWTVPEERARFVRVHAPTLAEIREGSAALGKGDKAEALLTQLEVAPPDETATTEAAILRERRLRRHGLRLLGLNVVVLILAIGGLVLSGPRPQAAGMMVPFLVGLISLALGTAIALIYAAVRFLIGLLIPRLRHGGGGMLLLLALAGWLGCLFVPFLCLIER